MTGYSVFAELIGSFKQLNVYRRFDCLTAKMLLYQQAEIVHLEADLRAVVESDKQRHETAGFDQSWWEMRAAPAESGGDYQRRKVAEIQGKLKEYRSLQPPDTRVDWPTGLMICR